MRYKINIYIVYNELRIAAAMSCGNRSFTLKSLCKLTNHTYPVEVILTKLAIEWLFPEHQRKHRWSSAMNANFICSLMQNIPIPPIHLCDDYHVTRTGKRYINDGGHRLRCIYQYCRNMFPILVKNENGTVSNVFFDCKPNERSTRVPFGSTIQMKVLKQQNFICNVCKSHIGGDCEFDHIVPLFKGGSTGEDNCQALCSACHSDKTKTEASERAKTSIGSLCDRVMTDGEKRMFLRRDLNVIQYGDYDGDAKEIQREIFDRVQNSATISVNDYVSSHTTDPLVVHLNKQFENPRSPLSRMEAVVEDLSRGTNDWWSTEATTENQFAYVVALFTSIAGTRSVPEIDSYHPVKANKLSDAECSKEWKSNATKEQLQTFDNLIDSVIDVLAMRRVHRVQYTDFAIFCHCFYRWGLRWPKAVAKMSDSQFNSVMREWESKSLQEDKITHKMGSLTADKWEPRSCFINTRKRSR